MSILPRPFFCLLNSPCRSTLLDNFRQSADLSPSQVRVLWHKGLGGGCLYSSGYWNWALIPVRTIVLPLWSSIHAMAFCVAAAPLLAPTLHANQKHHHHDDHHQNHFAFAKGHHNDGGSVCHRNGAEINIRWGNRIQQSVRMNWFG